MVAVVVADDKDIGAEEEEAAPSGPGVEPVEGGKGPGSTLADEGRVESKSVKTSLPLLELATLEQERPRFSPEV